MAPLFRDARSSNVFCNWLLVESNQRVSCKRGPLSWRDFFLLPSPRKKLKLAPPSLIVFTETRTLERGRALQFPGQALVFNTNTLAFPLPLPVERLKQLVLEYLHDSIRSAKERALLTLPTHSISDCKTAQTSSFPAVFLLSIPRSRTALRKDPWLRIGEHSSSVRNMMAPPLAG